MDNPVYIIGNNALAYYLGAQMQKCGNRVIVLKDGRNSSDFSLADDFSVKEERSLGQKKYKLPVADSMKESAKAVIITSYANKINTAASCLSAAAIGDAPVVCFTPLKDMSYLAPIVGGNLHPAFFHGYAGIQKNIVSVSRGVKIVICPSEQKIIDQSAVDIFASAKIQTETNEDHNYCFWEYFAPYALGSILSAAEDRKMSEIVKDKSKNDLLQALIAEFVSLAAADGVTLGEKAIMKTVNTTPENYVYPLHKSLANGGKDEFNLITSVITEAILKSAKNYPDTQNLLKKLYNSVLNKTL